MLDRTVTHRSYKWNSYFTQKQICWKWNIINSLFSNQTILSSSSFHLKRVPWFILQDLTYKLGWRFDLWTCWAGWILFFNLSFVVIIFIDSSTSPFQGELPSKKDLDIRTEAKSREVWSKLRKKLNTRTDADILRVLIWYNLWNKQTSNLCSLVFCALTLNLNP